jgi:antitoxin component YwqK of YwqJK toxin-antitoxin module
MYINVLSQTNTTDNKGMKQGNWVYTTTDTVKPSVVLIRSDNTSASQKAPEKRVMTFVLENGNYTDNKRNGEWIINYYKKGEPDNYKLYTVTFRNDSIIRIVSVFRDGKVKGDISYLNNEPIGTFKIYYPDGQIKADGVALKGAPFFKGTEYYTSAGSYYNRPKNFNKELLEKENVNIKSILVKLKK